MLHAGNLRSFLLRSFRNMRCLWVFFFSVFICYSVLWVYCNLIIVTAFFFWMEIILYRRACAKIHLVHAFWPYKPQFFYSRRHVWVHYTEFLVGPFLPESHCMNSHFPGFHYFEFHYFEFLVSRIPISQIPFSRILKIQIAEKKNVFQTILNFCCNFDCKNKVKL